jgi:hypothetical protein
MSAARSCRRLPSAAAPAPLFVLLCLLLAPLAAPAAPAASPPPGFNQKLGNRPRRPAQIGTSFIQTSFWDLEADIGGGKTTCETVVDRSQGFNTKAIAVVLTVEARGYEGGLEQFFYKGKRVVWRAAWLVVVFFSFAATPALSAHTLRDATNNPPPPPKNNNKN